MALMQERIQITAVLAQLPQQTKMEDDVPERLVKLETQVQSLIVTDGQTVIHGSQFH